MSYGFAAIEFDIHDTAINLAESGTGFLRGDAYRPKERDNHDGYRPLTEDGKRRIEKARELLAHGPIRRCDLLNGIGVSTTAAESVMMTLTDHMLIWEDGSIVGLMEETA